MDGYTVERSVPGGPPTVRSAIEALVRALWGGRARLVADEVGGLRVDALAADSDSDADDVDVWLSWELTPEHDSTRVRLRLDELDTGPDPTEALDQLLDMVAAAVRERRTTS